jgi:hypothetical protein
MQVLTTTPDERLPAPFLDLAHLLDWALETENERHAKRVSSTIAQTRVLYDALAPRMDAIIGHLQQFSFAAPLAPADHALFLLALSYIEVAQPIELNWKQTVNEGSYPSTRLNRPHRR